MFWTKNGKHNVFLIVKEFEFAWLDQHLVILLYMEWLDNFFILNF